MTPERLRRLTHASRVLDEILNRAPNRQAPYVGEAAFATKAGIHASAILKEPATYEHVPPESVGNRRRVLVSDQAGKSNLVYELERLGIPLGKSDDRVGRLLEEVKAREALGYAYEGADASFELLARRLLGEVPAVLRGRQLPRHGREAPQRARAGWSPSRRPPSRCSSTAARSRCGRWRRATARSTRSIRRCARTSGATRSIIKDVELVDYKVRILTGGTEAVTRVLVESRDKGTGERWFTVGVSPNIVDASFEALIDSITYKLLKAGAEAA